MSDDAPDRKGFDELKFVLLSEWEMIEAILAQLPVPIRIPTTDENWDAATALPAIYRAREILVDQPLDRLTIVLLRSMIIDWCAAYELALTVTVLGEDPWRMDALEIHIARIAFALEHVDNLLGPDGE